jgi:hypothetical protein
MGISFGNKEIVTDGLIWMVDIGNLGSYNGTNTVIDLAGNNNATLVGPQSYDATTNGGELTYAGNQISTYIRFPEAALNSLTSGSEWTIETWLSINTTSGTTYLHSQARAATDNNYLILRSGSGISAWNETLEAGSTLSYTSGTTFCFTIRHSGSSQRYYKNGVFAAQYSAANDISLTESWRVFNNTGNSLFF